MKKTRQVFACLMACMLMVSLFATTASAKTYYGESAKVYVDDSRIKNIDAYVGRDGEIRVEDESDIYRIFPDEMEDIFILPTDDGILVREWVDYFGYTCNQDENELYIYTDETLYIPDPPLSIPDSPADVFVNGIRVNNVGVYISNGKAYIEDYNVLYKLFPNETKDTYFITSQEATSLESWAERYDYSYAQNGIRVYLNNNGNTPVEVQVDGTTVSFIDQQPIILPPGRTMVPIRTVSELIGCTVEWDGEHNRVIIKKGTNTLLLWVNSYTYWMNGEYYKTDVKPQIINERTMVSLRLVSEAFGFKVSYEDSGDIGIVKLSSK